MDAAESDAAKVMTRHESSHASMALASVPTQQEEFQAGTARLDAGLPGTEVSTEAGAGIGFGSSDPRALPSSREGTSAKGCNRAPEVSLMPWQLHLSLRQFCERFW